MLKYVDYLELFGCVATADDKTALLAEFSRVVMQPWLYYTKQDGKLVARDIVSQEVRSLLDKFPEFY